MRLTGNLLRLAPSDIANFLGCRHRIGLDLAAAFGDLTRPSRPDPFADSLRARGEEHEQRFVEQLRGEGLAVEDLRGHPNAADQTIACLHSGVEVIVQAQIQGGDWNGYADVLRRVPTPSALGDWSYEVYDTKLARETRGATILQLSAYSQILGGLQGLVPASFHVVTPDAVNPIHTYRVEDYAAYFRMVRAAFLGTIALGHEAIRARHYPDPVEDCEMCRWFALCNGLRRKDDHLSFVAGMSRMHREELAGRGYPTLAKAAVMPLPLPFKPSRGSKPAYERLREQARLQLEQRERKTPVFELLEVEAGRGFCKLPAPDPGDLFLDLEGDPFAREGGREYLFGLWDPRSGGYHAWWALDDGEERTAFETVTDLIATRLDEHPGMHVYHFGHYEPSAFKRLSGRHATRGGVLDRLLRGERFVDLHAVVRGGIRAGVESYSIKRLEPLYAFARDVSLDHAREHLHAVELALESRAGDLISAANREGVEGYNRDDCRSTLALRDWLEERRAELVRTCDVPRPAAEDDTPSDKVKALDEEVERLRERLLEAIPADRQDRDEQQQARWLLAYLIDWHRREEKADWWEFFRLIELEDDDLLDEPKAVAGLRFIERVEVVKRKSGKPTGSVIDRYAYPAQDVDIRSGNPLKTQDGASWATVQDIDTEAQCIDVKKGPEKADVHPPSAFVEDVIPTEVLQRSVMRLADAFLAGERTSGTDLLLRRPPRLRHTEAAKGATTSGVATLMPASGETSVDTAVRLVAQLDRTTLAVQGPPGAGKTYAGAKMIGALVKAGLRVGVTAVSHKVIRNLLDSALAAAAKDGSPVRAGHKVGKEKASASTVVEIVENKAALAALASGDINVLGGTAWLWSRTDATNVVDVLFVDEAGQMSLANVLGVSQAAKNTVLLGDPQQLDQPASASHPDGVGISALHHVLDGAPTMPEGLGLFLPHTWRLAPSICAFTSEVFYESKLQPKAGLERQRLAGTRLFDGAGLWWIPAAHDNNQNYSTEEVEVVSQAVDLLLAPGARWVDEHGVERPLTGQDLRVVAAYNAQVNRLADRLADRGVPVGTVDKFQGQEGPVVIYSMAASRPEDAPRGMEFLFSLNRLNVATSRARCAALLVGSPRLLEAECRTPRQIRLANALCRYRERATEVHLPARTGDG